MMATAALAGLMAGSAAAQPKKPNLEHPNYIDGVNNLDYWTGKTDQSARDEYLY